MSDILYPVLAGLMTATWGAYKDTPYEGFSRLSFVRSILVTTIYFVILKETTSESSLVLVLAASAGERFTQEIWKAFFRLKQREKIYLIPQGFHIFGKEVKSYPKKLFAGIILIGSFFFVFSKLLPVQIENYSTKVAIILLFGLMVSLGGAWKDAPIEGFELAKFPRSVFVTVLVGVVISQYVNSLGILVLASLGLERYLVEFYKTFIVRKTPGKFFENILYPDLVKKRILFKYTYAMALLGLASLSLF